LVVIESGCSNGPIGRTVPFTASTYGCDGKNLQGFHADWRKDAGRQPRSNPRAWTATVIGTMTRIRHLHHDVRREWNGHEWRGLSLDPRNRRSRRIHVRQNLVDQDRYLHPAKWIDREHRLGLDWHANPRGMFITNTGGHVDMNWSIVMETFNRWFWSLIVVLLALTLLLQYL